MASGVAKNANPLFPYGAHIFLEANPDNRKIPLEQQIPLTITQTSNTPASASKTVPITNVWENLDDPTTGDVIYTLSVDDIKGLSGRETIFAFDGTAHAANSVIIQLPANSYYVYPGGVVGAALQNMKILPNAQCAFTINWGSFSGVTLGSRVIVSGDLTGFNFS